MAPTGLIDSPTWVGEQIRVTTDDLSEEATSEEHALRCHVCGGSRFEVLQEQRDLDEDLAWLRDFHRVRLKSSEDPKDLVDFTQSETTNIVACDGCGTVYRNPQLTPEAVSKRYRKDRYGDKTLESLLQNALPFFERKASDLARFMSPGAHLLEVGSFVGAFMRAAEGKGWSIEGVDIGEETSDFCRRKGLSVATQPIEQCGWNESTFDAICIWNTFDQVANPRELLSCCRALVKDDGLLVLRFPNGGFHRRTLELRGRHPELSRKMAAYNNFIPFPYLAGYTTRSVELLLNQHGFEVIEWRGDTIQPLSSDGTTEAGFIEEQRIKRLVTRWATLQQKGFSESLFPWIDVFARATWQGSAMGG